MITAARTLALSAMLGIAGLTSAPMAAQADGLYLNFNDDGDTRFGVYAGDHAPRHYRPDFEERRGRGCTPDRALDKADRMGIHRARIIDVSRHTITVAGRDRGERVVVTFGRGRHCPVLSY